MKTILIMTGTAAVMMGAYFRHMLGNNVRMLCIAPNTDLDPRLVQVLREDGVEPTDPMAALVDIHMGAPFDLVVTLNTQAQQEAAALPAVHRIHCSINERFGSNGDHGPMRELYRMRNEVKFLAEDITLRLKGRLV